MKNTVLILAFFMCFLGCVGIPNKSASDVRIPVTSEIVDLVLKNEKNLGDLKYYLFPSGIQVKPIILEINEQKNAAEVFINKNMLVINPPDSKKKLIVFSVDTEGKLIEISVKGELLTVFFQNNNTTLRFLKNQQGYFEPCSVIIPDNNNKYTYSISPEGELPRLYVFGQDNRKIHNNPTNVEVRKEPVYDQNQQDSNKVASIDVQNKSEQNSPNNLPSPSTVSTIYPENQQPGNFVAFNGNNNYIIQTIGNPDEDYSPGRFPDTNIEGFYPINKNGVINYIKSNNRSLRWDIDPLITTYINEAREEGINPYLAIAQMLYRTDFLRNEQLERNYNYAGFEPTNVWNGRFHNMADGVRAHIQHLKGYASRMQPKHPIVDPRYNILIQNKYIGTAKTLQQLYGKWVPAANSVNYINRVSDIIKDLYRYQ